MNGASADATRSITVGVVGQPCRADVTAWGDVTPWGDPGAPAGTLRWSIAADDRWHDPSVEVAVRQHRVGGTPVVETRLRIPDGDAVQHVWSTPDRGGLTFVEVANDSPLPFAVAFSGLPVLTDRPPSDVPVEGIDLPSDAFVMPVGHHASVRVAIPHDPKRWVDRSLGEARGERSPVVDGWIATCDRASRLDLPDERLVTDVIAARCDLLLSGAVSPTEDPTGFVFDAAELVRLGEQASAWLPEIVPPIEAISRAEEPRVDAALLVAQRVAVAAGDDRAAGDISRIRARRQPGRARPAAPFSEIVRGTSAGRFVHEVERRLVSGGDLLPIGFPRSWLGLGIEVHRLPTGADSAVSYAVRWHGERPAVLWEQLGEPITLTATAVDSGWSTAEASGEALWSTPVQPRRLPVAGDTDSPSFG